MNINRRFFLKGALYVAAAPVVVKASSLMPVRRYNPIMTVTINGLDEYGDFKAIQYRALMESFRLTKEIVAARVLNESFQFKTIYSIAVA